MYKLMLMALGLGLPLMASANRYNDVQYGRVVEVEPIYQWVNIPQDRQVCERIRRPHNNHNQQRRERVGSTILGGIIGGAIGNKFGRGSGRDASTALGILVGASIGSAKADRHGQRSRCYVETDYHEEQRFMGYDVTYEYNGDLYYTQMQEHPGDRIRLRVDVEVID